MESISGSSEEASYMENVEAMLMALPLFRGFSASDLQGLIDRSQVRTYQPGEVIIEFGQPGRFLGIMLSGEAEAAVTEPSGGRRRLGPLGKGDILGEMSLLTGEPTSADVIALGTSELLLVPQDIFSAYLAVNPEAIKVMARTMSGRIAGRQQNEEAQARVRRAWRSAPDPYGLRLSTATPMKILVINCGSSSIKYSYLDTLDRQNNLKGLVERIGLANTRISTRSAGGEASRELGWTDYGEAFSAIVNQITDPDHGVIRDLGELTAIGHRVVHGGDKYSDAVIIDDEVIAEIERDVSLAPLHNPVNLMGINEARKLLPGVPQVAVFDTGFHHKMPPQAYLYGIPYDLFEQDRIRKYGFHGISHNYVALQAATSLKRDFRELKIITCHLGNGASVCAIDHGRSIDTSMGFTPLEGLMMGTRSGDMDPSVVFHLHREKGMSLEEIERVLNRESGLLGVSGISSDFRELEDAANKGDPRAVLTVHAFCYRIRKYIGAYLAALGGLDALVFTGGIGEGSAWVRSLACQGLGYMGIEVDDVLNRAALPRADGAVEVSGEDSVVKVLMIPTDEERMIARETVRALDKRNVAAIIESQEERGIPVEVSAHHVHLSRDDVETLFGTEHELTRRSDLSQPGQFACEETVGLVGPRGRVDRVRVLDPTRGQSQVEISMTEEYRLGVKAPIRASGDLEGSPGIVLEGAEGARDAPQGVICALRHIHMSPEDALYYGLKDRDVVTVEVRGDRTLAFGDVLVRVDPNFRLSMHIDTDEANAAHVTTGMVGHLVGVQDRR